MAENDVKPEKSAEKEQGAAPAIRQRIKRITHWIKRHGVIITIVVTISSFISSTINITRTFEGKVIRWFKPDYLSVQKSINMLLDRDPCCVITSLAGDNEITYTDFEGCGDYGRLWQAAMEKLEKHKVRGLENFRGSEILWKNEERAWDIAQKKIDPLIRIIRQIKDNQEKYYDCNNSAVARCLIGFSPSSKRLLEIQKEVEDAENQLKNLLTEEILNKCNRTYISAVRIYTNIGEPRTYESAAEAAERINKNLKNVNIEQLQKNFLSLRDELKKIFAGDSKERFINLSEKCLEKANEDYNDFDLENAKGRFDILTQIYRTIANVQNEINFGNYKAVPAILRLIELCSTEYETFQKYPEVLNRLKDVYKRKDVFAGYGRLCKAVNAGPQYYPEDVYKLAIDARELLQDGNDTEVSVKLKDANEKYRKFILNTIDGLVRDRDRLSSISKKAGIETFIAESPEYEALKGLRGGVNKKYSEVAYENADECNKYLVSITREKDVVKHRFVSEANSTITNIRDCYLKEIERETKTAKLSECFWKSEKIAEYVNIAKRYAGNDIANSINGWKDVDDITRLSTIVDKVKDVNSYLGEMLARKGELDKLAGYVSEISSVCKSLPAGTEIGTEKREDWLLQLEGCKKKLAEEHKNDNKSCYLIDHSNKLFIADYEEIRRNVKIIDDKLPRHSAYVRRLIEDAEFLEMNGKDVNDALCQWQNVAKGKIAEGTFDINSVSRVRIRLSSIKMEVDKWQDEPFNREMRNHCQVLAGAVDWQCQITDVVSNAVKELDKRIKDILNDKDVCELRARFVRDYHSTILEQLQSLFNQNRKILDAISVPVATCQPTQFIGQDKDYANFNINDIKNWTTECSATKERLKERSSPLKNIKSALPPEIIQQLRKQESIEIAFFNELKKATTVDLCRQSALIAKRIKEVEDSGLSEMYEFIKKAGNSSAAVPLSPQELRKRLLIINNRIRELESYVAKDFEDIKNAAQKVNVNSNEILNILIKNLNAEIDKWNERDIKQKFLDVCHLIKTGNVIEMNSMPQLQPVDHFGNPLQETEIVKTPERFFYTDRTYSGNFGWPRCARNKNDPTVRFIFIPAGPNISKPFYIATNEITYAQYCRFLNAIGARSISPNYKVFTSPDGKQNLVYGKCSLRDYPCTIGYNGSKAGFSINEADKNKPMIWVTFNGANYYAAWFGGQLPTVAQYKYAANAYSRTSYLWENALTKIQPHIRSKAWQNAAIQYNKAMSASDLDRDYKVVPIPIGAVGREGDVLDCNKLVNNNGSVNESPWPIASAAQTNVWGLYDMIGNVWEWCRDEYDARKTLICGGSCLAPPECFRSSDPYYCDFNGTSACDVGFRVIIPVQ